MPISSLPAFTFPHTKGGEVRPPLGDLLPTILVYGPIWERAPHQNSTYWDLRTKALCTKLFLKTYGCVVNVECHPIYENLSTVDAEWYPFSKDIPQHSKRIPIDRD